MFEIEHIVLWSKVFTTLFVGLITQVVLCTIIGTILRLVWTIVDHILSYVLYIIYIMMTTFYYTNEHLASFILWIANLILQIIYNPLIILLEIYIITVVVIICHYDIELSYSTFYSGMLFVCLVYIIYNLQCTIDKLNNRVKCLEWRLNS